MTATLIPNLTPGDPDWAARMSASKVAAVVGHSPYESRFSLWHKMTGQLPWDDGDGADEKARGHYLEPALRQWFRDHHPESRVLRTGTWQSDRLVWQIATPDALVDDDALLECKTSTKDLEWGEPGTAEVPPGYYDQAQWAMHVTGRRRCWFAVLTSFLTFVEYVVDYEPDYAAELDQAAGEFMDSLTGPPPPLDAHAETYVAVRRLHPDIDDVDVELPPELVASYVWAKTQRDAAEADYRETAARIAHELGSGRRAVTAAGQTVAYRQPGRNGSAPYLKPARGLGLTALK